MNNLWLIIVLALLLVVASGLWVKLFAKVFQRKLLTKKFAKYLNSIPEGDFQKARSTINRIDILARNNKKYQKISLQLIKTYDDIERELQVLEQLKIKIKEQLKKPNIQKKEIVNQLSTFNANIRGTKKILVLFFKIADVVIYQDEFMRNEFMFYQKNLRLTLEYYELQINNFSLINGGINKLRQQITSLEKQYEKLIRNTNWEKAYQILGNYTIKVVRLIQLVNDGGSLNSALTSQLPRGLKEIQALKNTTKLNWQVWMNEKEHISSINQLQKEIQKAKQAFMNLNLSRAKQKTKLALQKMINLQNLIKQEERASKLWKYFVHFQEREIKNFAIDFLEFKKQVQKLNNHKIIVSLNLNHEADVLEKKWLNFQQEAKNKLSILEKEPHTFLFKIQELYFLLQQFVNLKQIFERLKNQTIREENNYAKVINKIIRLQNALEMLVLKIQSKSRFFYEKHAENLTKLLVFKDQILLASKSVKNYQILLKQTQEFEEKFQKFYKIVNVELQMEYLSHKIISEAFKYRLSTKQVNFDLKKAEKNYLEGRYQNALESIANVLPKQKNK